MLEKTYKHKTSVVSSVDTIFSEIVDVKKKKVYLYEKCCIYAHFHILVNVDLKIVCLLGDKCGIDLRQMMCLLGENKYCAYRINSMCMK